MKSTLSTAATLNVPTTPAKAAKTVREFCAAYGISRATFYDLCAKFKGPRILQLGRGVRISLKAEQDWVRERETIATAAQGKAGKPAGTFASANRPAGAV